MEKPLGRGPFGSLRARVRHDIRTLFRENDALRQARYSLPRRLVGSIIINRSIIQFLALYAFILAVALVCEWAGNYYTPSKLPGYYGAAPRDFLKDVGSYLIAAQIGILAIVSVAVGVVTLLSERNDGSSVNTDIRLYYVESYSYELAISGVALLVVLTLQLFWPAQHLLHAVGLGGRNYVFKLALAAFHALWFTANLLLFLQFIRTTLRFVEPSRRERLRERYSANEVIPRDATRRLMRALYHLAPQQIFGKEELKQGPSIVFGFSAGLGQVRTPEMTTVFSCPVQLVDVRLRPLEWVMRRWQSRVRKKPEAQKRMWQPAWDDQLTIIANFEDIFTGRSEWVLRRGDVPLTGLEKWVVKRCFRFRRVLSREQDLPTPENFLEQLINKVVRQIEESAETGFRAALTEAIRYHQFILAVQNTKDDAGYIFNLAEIGGFISRPDVEWVAQYRRAYTSAADKIGGNTLFIDRLSYLAAQLVPDDALNFSSRVLRGLLDLGVYQVVALEDWVTKRALLGSPTSEVGASTALSGSDKRAYEDVLTGFVGGWERLLQALILSFGLERESNAEASDQAWRVFSASFQTLLTHLRNAAYFFAASVWNDDALGADRYRDLVLRWLQPFYSNLESSYLFSNTVLFTPELTNQNWPEVQSECARDVLFSHDQVRPGPVSGVLLWELHNDVVSVSGLVALHWYVNRQQPSELASQSGLLMLRRQVRASDGSTLAQTTPKSMFRLLFDFVVRYGLNPRFAENSYSATLDELVRYLTNLATPRMVSGRIYGGFGINGVETLRPVLLGAMAGSLPTEGDDGVAALIDRLKIDPLFQNDETVRTLIWSIQENSNFLADAQRVSAYSDAARIFSPDVDLTAATERLRSIFNVPIAAFQALRKERLRNAPWDESRMQVVRDRVTEAMRGASIACFEGYLIRSWKSGEIAVTEQEFGVIDKGAFVTPPMSKMTFGDYPRHFISAGRECLARSVWHEFFQLPKRVISLNISSGREPFWRRAIEEGAKVGPAPVVLVPFSRFGEDITAARYRLPHAGLDEFNVSRLPNMPSGDGIGYLGTIGGLHVYSANLKANKAFLCSSQLILAIDYGVVHGENDLFDFSFIESDEPESSNVRLKVAQRISWADYEVVEFSFAGEDIDTHSEY